jgi:hypothetical protein
MCLDVTVYTPPESLLSTKRLSLHACMQALSPCPTRHLYGSLAIAPPTKAACRRPSADGVTKSGNWDREVRAAMLSRKLQTRPKKQPQDMLCLVQTLTLPEVLSPPRGDQCNEGVS